MTTHDRSPRPAPVDSLAARTLDEQQARDRAEVHSINDARTWDVLRTQAGHHVCLEHIDPRLLPTGFIIVTTYRNGKEV